MFIACYMFEVELFLYERLWRWICCEMYRINRNKFCLWFFYYLVDLGRILKTHLSCSCGWTQFLVNFRSGNFPSIFIGDNLNSQIPNASFAMQWLMTHDCDQIEDTWEFVWGYSSSCSMFHQELHHYADHLTVNCTRSLDQAEEEQYRGELSVTILGVLLLLP